MIKLNIIDKFLIRLGIATKNYRLYVHYMQKALDREHMEFSEYYNKYYNTL